VSFADVLGFVLFWYGFLFLYSEEDIERYMVIMIVQECAVKERSLDEVVVYVERVYIL